MVRVLLADDQRLARLSHCVLLKRGQDIDVIGQASDGQEAIELTQELKPDVVCMDIHMPRLNGLEATAAIRDSCPFARVLIVAMTVSEEFVKQALQNGAQGYVAKTEAYGELVNAVRTVFNGGRYYSASVAELIKTMGWKN